MKKLVFVGLLLVGASGCKQDSFQQVGVESIQGQQWTSADTSYKFALVVTRSAFVTHIEQTQRVIPYQRLAPNLLLLDADTVRLYMKDGRKLRISPINSKIVEAESIDLLYGTDYLPKK